MLSPRVAIATFLAFGVAFIAIGIPILISAAGVVEVTSVDYADSSVCSSNPCEFELEVTERLVAPVYMYYRLTNYYQNHRLYVRLSPHTRAKAPPWPAAARTGALRLSKAAGSGREAGGPLPAPAPHHDSLSAACARCATAMTPS